MIRQDIPAGLRRISAGAVVTDARNPGRRLIFQRWFYATLFGGRHVMASVIDAETKRWRSMSAKHVQAVAMLRSRPKCGGNLAELAARRNDPNIAARAAEFGLTLKQYLQSIS